MPALPVAPRIPYDRAELGAAVVAYDSSGSNLSELSAADIEKLESKRRGLESDARLSQKRCEDQAEAVARLRKLAPSFVADAVRRRRNEIDHSLGREIADARIRKNEIECCLSPDRYPNQQSYLENLRRSCRAAVIEGLDGQYIKRRLSESWPTLRRELEAELAELTESMQKKQTQYADLMSQWESQLDHYAG